MKFLNKPLQFFYLFVPLYGAGVRFRVLLRLREFCRKNRMTFLGCCIKSYLHKRYGCEISINAAVSPRAEFMHTTGVIIGEGVTVKDGVKFYGNINLGKKDVLNTDDYPTIGENVILSTGSSVLGKVKVGENTIIGAHSLVMSDCESNSVYVGNPLRRIK